MALTDVTVRNAKPREKAYKLSDSGGLYLSVTPAGGKLWRFKFRVDGKEKLLALGAYPAASLSDARKGRDDAKRRLSEGADPAREKQRDKLQARQNDANTFELIAREYFDKRKRDGDRPWAVATANKNEWLLGQLAPYIGKLAVASITPADVLGAVRKIEGKGNLESARRALQISGSIMRYAVATARLASDPTRDLRGALTTPRVTHRAAILDAVKLGELLRAIDSFSGHFTTRQALALAPHVFLRPGELRHARWEEIDLEGALWIIPADKTKMRKPHHVPLSRQAIEILREARELSRTEAEFVFPSLRTSTRPMSDNTLNAALRRMGYDKTEMTAHGFRATASTLLNESGKWSPDAIERALAHGDDDKVRGAYHRGAHWKERVEMAQWWSDHLDQLRKGADIVPFTGRTKG